jgi:DNA excision repair protein ERCC-2
LKALAMDKHDKIAFLTAKSVGRRAAEETLSHFVESGYRGNALSITAKDTICLSPGKACHADDCPFARGYYDKLPEAMLAAIKIPVLRRQELEELARRFEVCPYQLTLDLQPWIDVVIGDLHHLYGLPAMLAAQLETGRDRWTVLLDEAHNLPSRARGMFSASLHKQELMSARSGSDRALHQALNQVNRAMLALQKESWQELDFDAREELPEKLIDSLKRFVTDCGEQQAQDATYLHRQPALLEFYFSVLQFLRTADNWGSEYRFELARGKSKQSLVLRLNCLDPARLLAGKQSPVHSLTAFSATLSPAAWMRSALGLTEEAVYRRLGSPFSADQMAVSVATHVDTRYRQRQDSLGELSALVQKWLAEVPGNCIVYFPSYRYLYDCVDRVMAESNLSSQRSVWIQQRSQSDSDRLELLQNLESKRDVAAFCILGGVFGEGIDLPGERLKSVVVVGVGLPQVNRDTEQLRDYFASRYGRGFEYAYLYPGMQKVDQALGRVIRRLDDRGSALLVDQRFSQPEYRELLPPWWAYRNFYSR